MGASAPSMPPPLKKRSYGRCTSAERVLGGRKEMQQQPCALPSKWPSTLTQQQPIACAPAATLPQQRMQSRTDTARPKTSKPAVTTAHTSRICLAASWRSRGSCSLRTSGRSWARPHRCSSPSASRRRCAGASPPSASPCADIRAGGSAADRASAYLAGPTSEALPGCASPKQSRAATRVAAATTAMSTASASSAAAITCERSGPRATARDSSKWPSHASAPVLFDTTVPGRSGAPRAAGDPSGCTSSAMRSDSWAAAADGRRNQSCPQAAARPPIPPRRRPPPTRALGPPVDLASTAAAALPRASTPAHRIGRPKTRASARARR
eukprot:scaffold12045_cov109-Isochrysis_galbana.AAC.2